MALIPQDTSVQAEYADGYIHDETTLNDVSPYVEFKNIFDDILHKRPEAEHGPMVRFAVFYKNAKYDIDWTTLPVNARPIRFRDRQFVTDYGTGKEWIENIGCRFGYQYNDESGKNHQEVQEL